jgi:hypothetical protein
LTVLVVEFGCARTAPDIKNSAARESADGERRWKMKASMIRNSIQLGRIKTLSPGRTDSILPGGPEKGDRKKVIATKYR